MSHTINRKRLLTKVISGYAALVFTISLCCNAQASGPVQRPADTSNEETVIMVNDEVVITGRIGVGMLSGESHEYAYNAGSGTKLSELTWSFDSNVMLGVGLSLKANNWLKFNGDVWFKITESSSMDDYDWFIENGNWTHWSHHDDVDLSSGSMFDINAEFNFFRPDNFTFFGILGFKKDSWAWDGRGGNYIYSVNGFRDTTGSFTNGQQVISYEQDFNVPYLGVGLSAEAESFFFTARIIGSAFVDASAEDTHYLRNLHFKDEFSSGTMVGFDVSCSYFFTPGLSVSAAFHYQDYPELKGTSIITDTTTGQRYATSDDTTGLSHSSSLVSLGMQYRF